MTSQLLRFSSFKVSLRSWRRRSALLLAVVALSWALAPKTVRLALAGHYAESNQPSEVRRAVDLDPANAECHYRLGIVSYRSLAILSTDNSGSISSSEAIEQLRQATELSPRQAPYWSDLGEACDTLGDSQCADRAFARALELGPMTPRIQWFAANHYLRKGDRDTALAHFRELLLQEPSYAVPTFDICLRLVDDPEAIYERVLPHEASLELKLGFVNALVDHDKVEMAYQVWSQAIQGTRRFPFDLAKPFIEKVLSLGQLSEATAIWQDLIRLNVVTRPPDQPNDLVFNGDFEQIPLNAGFDWRYVDTPFVSLDFSDPSAYRGGRCLRVDFTVGRNEEFEPVYQYVPVLAGQTYLLSAYTRSDELTSDSGPRLRVTDPSCKSCLDVWSEMTTGTRPWHRVSVSFTVHPPTRLVRVSVWRQSGRTFPMEIAGTFRVDAVYLVQILGGGVGGPSGSGR